MNSLSYTGTAQYRDRALKPVQAQAPILSSCNSQTILVFQYFADGPFYNLIIILGV